MKKDGGKCVVSHSVSSDKEPVKLTLAIKGKEKNQQIVEDQSAKSECAKLIVPKSKEELPKHKRKV